MILGHYRQHGGKPLGCIAGRSLLWFTGIAGGNRAAAGWFAMVALPQSLSAPAPLCGTGPARGKSFRPTASSPYRKATIKSLQKDRKSTRLNSSHGYISYAVFCLKKKKQNNMSDVRDNRHTAAATAPPRPPVH